MKKFILYWMGILAKFEIMFYNEREKIITRRINIKEAKRPK